MIPAPLTLNPFTLTRSVRKRESPCQKDSSDKPPVEERAHSPTSSQGANPAEGGLPAMPMPAPVENSLD